MAESDRVNSGSPLFRSQQAAHRKTLKLTAFYAFTAGMFPCVYIFFKEICIQVVSEGLASLVGAHCHTPHCHHVRIVASLLDALDHTVFVVSPGYMGKPQTQSHTSLPSPIWVQPNSPDGTKAHMKATPATSSLPSTPLNSSPRTPRWTIPRLCWNNQYKKEKVPVGTTASFTPNK